MILFYNFFSCGYHDASTNFLQILQTDLHTFP